LDVFLVQSTNFRYSEPRSRHQRQQGHIPRILPGIPFGHRKEPAQLAAVQGLDWFFHPLDSLDLQHPSTMSGQPFDCRNAMLELQFLDQIYLFYLKFI
jgi:hypothetical protein